jgi:hypothetical protein
MDEFSNPTAKKCSLKTPSYANEEGMGTNEALMAVCHEAEFLAPDALHPPKLSIRKVNDVVFFTHTSVVATLSCLLIDVLFGTRNCSTYITRITGRKTTSHLYLKVVLIT